MKNTAKRMFFTGEYKLEDLDCIYCLYYPGPKQPCPLKKCCCEEERAEARKREQLKNANRTSKDK
jgi:hypothetical protein